MARRRAATPSPRAAADERVRVHVRATHRRSKRRYGAPRVHRELRAAGVRTARKRVARLMREDGLLDAVPALRTGRRGRPRRRPAKLHVDRGYDYQRCRDACRRRHIAPRIARRGTGPRDRLGRHRWVVERTLAWFSQFRRLRVRDERRDDIHDAFLALGCSVICFRHLEIGFR